MTGDQRPPAPASRRGLRMAALIAATAGAAGSFAFMLRSGHPPLFLVVLFTVWVLSPFAVFIAAATMSARWSAATQTTLYVVMLVVTVASLAIYGRVAFGPPRNQRAFWFVIVPPLSWLATAIAVGTAAFTSRKRAR